MSSIAYVTDHEMIEYHRLHGATKIVFWRPTSQKKFHNFHYGDYLFFLTKGTEKGRNREKGMVGYGRYLQEDVRGVHELWKKYKKMTGYGSEAQLQEAIIKLCKGEPLPEKLHCLILEGVRFFQAPIYLSELNMKVSKQLESYCYLDQENYDTGWKILKKASEVGIDMWSSLVEHQNVGIDQDADMILMQSIYEKLKTNDYSAYEKQRITQFSKAYMKTSTGTFLAGGMDDFMVIKDYHTYVYFPCLTSMKNWKKHLLTCIGRYVIATTLLKEKGSNASITILFDEPLREAKLLCEQGHIQYEIANTTKS